MRRRAAVVAPLAATALGLGLGTGTAGAAELARTDTFTFTNSAGARVTCTVESTQDLSGTGTLRVSTTLSGPSDCIASSMDIAVEYHRRSDGSGHRAVVEGEGRSLSATYDDVAPSVRSSHFVSVEACDCGGGYDLQQSK
jgi:hypothetical protein